MTIYHKIYLIIYYTFEISLNKVTDDYKATFCLVYSLFYSFYPNLNKKRGQIYLSIWPLFLHIKLRFNLFLLKAK